MAEIIYNGLSTYSRDHLQRIADDLEEITDTLRIDREKPRVIKFIDNCLRVSTSIKIHLAQRKD